jgi:hypothetical protein
VRQGAPYGASLADKLGYHEKKTPPEGGVFVVACAG